MALRKKRVPVFGLGVDTKTDPKQAPPGALLQLVNMRQARTGELAPRNGFTSLGAGIYASGGLSSLHPGLSGGLLGQANNWNAGGRPGILARYSPLAAVQGWLPAVANETNDPSQVQYSYPRMTALISGWSSPGGAFGVDQTDPDLAVGASAFGMSYSEPSASGSGTTLAGLAARDSVGGTVIHTQLLNASNTTGTDRPSVMVTGGTNNANPSSAYLCRIRIDTSASPYSLWVDNLSGKTPVSTKIVNADLSAAQPWFDAKAFRNGISGLITRFVVIYRATAGGVTILTFDPATNAIFGGPNNFPTVDASMALGILDDAANQEGPFVSFATAGSTNGIRYNEYDCTTATIAFSRQATIDATVTSGVRQVTGYLSGTFPNSVILWDLDATPTYTQSIKIGTWSGSAATSGLLQGSFGLYSRAFRASDGDYYVVASYDSAAYPVYVVYNLTRRQTTGLLMPGYAGGRRAAVSSLASVTTTGGVSYVPLTRKQAIGATGGSIAQRRSISVASMNLTAPLSRPRELGGTLFMPGGVLMRDDGVGAAWAVWPIPPESPTLAGLTDVAHPGQLTLLATYFYRLVLRTTDATGRVTRSAGSVPVSVTLTGTQNAVNITVPQPGTTDGADAMAWEVYRAGPAAAGATQYNRVGEFGTPTGLSSVTDFISDANAALGELLYSTGNVLENTATPSCNLLEVFGQRAWVVNAEDPTQLWFSKQYVAGSGIGFNSNNILSVTGDGRGAITALGALDGYLIAFKDAAIYAIGGAGPDNLGRGSFNPPAAVSLSVGCNNPSSVVATPDGLMFQGAKGIWLLDRGLSLSYIGAPVESFTSAAQVVDASLVQAYPEVRFVFASGTCIAYDYFQKRWYTYGLRVAGSTIVGCADSSTYGWCYATADGVVRQEVANATTDDGNGIVPVLAFPQLSLAGPNGLFRMYAVDILGEWIGSHTLSAQFELDGSGVLTTAQALAITSGGTYAYEVCPPGQKCSRVKAIFTVNPAPAGGTFKLSAVTFTVGVKQGNNIPYTNRLR